MAQIWKCSCGLTWEKWEMKITKHISQGRKQGEEHRLLGLVNDETGEILAKTMRQARDAGLIGPAQSKVERKSSANGGAPVEAEGTVRVAASVRARLVTEEVLLDGRMLLFYELAKIRYPNWDGTFGEWLWDIVLQFHLEHADELPVSTLLKQEVNAEEEVANA